MELVKFKLGGKNYIAWSWLYLQLFYVSDSLIRKKN